MPQKIYITCTATIFVFVVSLVGCSSHGHHEDYIIKPIHRVEMGMMWDHCPLGPKECEVCSRINQRRENAPTQYCLINIGSKAQFMTRVTTVIIRGQRRIVPFIVEEVFPDLKSALEYANDYDITLYQWQDEDGSGPDTKNDT